MVLTLIILITVIIRAATFGPQMYECIFCSLLIHRFFFKEYPLKCCFTKHNDVFLFLWWLNMNITLQPPYRECMGICKVECNSGSWCNVFWWVYPPDADDEVPRTLKQCVVGRQKKVCCKQKCKLQTVQARWQMIEYKLWSTEPRKQNKRGYRFIWEERSNSYTWERSMLHTPIQQGCVGVWSIHCMVETQGCHQSCVPWQQAAVFRKQALINQLYTIT